MVAPVSNKPIIRLTQRTIPNLRGVVEMSSFALGKEKLAPALTALFQRQGIELTGIQLDTSAKIRLLGMRPPLETRAAGETMEEILSSLELSVFLTPEKQLYILGDKNNQNSMLTPDRTGNDARNRIPSFILNPDDEIGCSPIAATPQPIEKPPLSQTGAYEIIIIDPNPDEPTIVIKNVKTNFVTGRAKEKPTRFAGECSFHLTVKLAAAGIVFSSMQGGLKPTSAYPEPLTGKISLSWIREPGTPSKGLTGWPVSYFIEDLNLREIVESLPVEYAPLRLLTAPVGAAPSPRLYDENGAIIQTEFDRRAARLEEMGVRLYSSYMETEKGGYPDYERDYWVEQDVEVEKRDPYPDWLQKELVARYDLIRPIFEEHGQAPLLAMFGTLHNRQVQELFKKGNDNSGNRNLSSFIELIQYFAKSPNFRMFEAWFWKNLANFANAGFGRTLFEVTNASPEEIDRMLNGY